MKFKFGSKKTTPRSSGERKKTTSFGKSSSFRPTTRNFHDDIVGRTLTTHDNFLGRNQTSEKKRPVAVIESNKRNELAVVPLSSRDGKHRTRLKEYQDGRSYFKHFVEIEDNEGKPIKVGEKFKENHPSHDLSSRDVEKIRDKVFEHSAPAACNREKIRKFRK